MKRKPRKILKPRPVPTDCRFCKGDEKPTYKKWEVLSTYLSERARIFPKTRTGLCAAHQRKVTQEIKRARHLALLPFMVKPL